MRKLGMVAVVLLSAVVMADEQECIKSDSPMYADWVKYGKPECWCYRKQFNGDADGKTQGPFRMSHAEFMLFLDNFNRVDLTEGAICADFDHKATGPFRVANPDLQAFLPYFSKPDPLIPECSMDWDGDGEDDYNFWVEP